MLTRCVRPRSGARRGDAGATEISVFCNGHRRTMECVGKSSLGGLTMYAPTLFPEGLSRERPGPGPALKAKPPRKRSSKRTARGVERWKAGRLPLSPKEQGASTAASAAESLRRQGQRGQKACRFRPVQAPVCDRGRLTSKAHQMTLSNAIARWLSRCFCSIYFSKTGYD